MAPATYCAKQNETTTPVIVTAAAIPVREYAQTLLFTFPLLFSALSLQFENDGYNHGRLLRFFINKIPNIFVIKLG